MRNDASIQVLDRTFRIIEILSSCSENISLAEVSALSGIAKSTTFRILKALKEAGYVAQNSYGQYYMTLKICTISRRVLDRTSIISIARPYLKRLCSTVRQTVHIVMREGSDTVYVDRYEDESAPFRMNSIVGKRRALHTAAVGKSILAALPDEEILAYWRSASKTQITPYTICNLETLFQEIAAIREKGYAFDHQENTLGICCVATSICDYIGNPTYAISISGPSELMTDDQLEAFSPFLLSTRNSIAAALGCP